jgi:YHS domain-containing protein
MKDYSHGEVMESIDPVCGRTVREADAEGKIGYEGQMYYFCSTDCRRAFEEDPGRYAGMQR